MKHILIWGVAGVLLAGGVVGLLLLAPPSKNSNSSAYLAAAVSSADHAKGNRDAKIVLVEYGDFQCPACALYEPVVEQLEEDYGDRMTFIYRHFPLRNVHAQADLAAQASEAAALQGRFWEMHDLLYQNQNEWAKNDKAEEIFVGYAVSLGLDKERFSQDMNSDAVKTKVENDFQGGVKSGVNGTPNFYLNGKKIENPGSYDEFKQLLNQELERNS
ncbi:MAG: DsbA family protein [Candidatus Wildermuthbacteria bacterium]|nr:DsbA family protein [Candidatus Wildermuthbacteria bacterium]